jgi:hypothetical protein
MIPKDVYYNASPLGYIPAEYYQQVCEMANIEYDKNDKRWIIYSVPSDAPPEKIGKLSADDRKLKLDKNGCYATTHKFNNFLKLRDETEQQIIALCKKAEYQTGIKWYQKIKSEHIYQLIIDGKEIIEIEANDKNKLKIYFNENQFEHCLF